MNYARSARSMSSTYSSALATTSISAQGRRWDSVFDSASSDLSAPPRISPVVITRLRLHASPMIEAACALSPAAATITTRSAVSTSSTRFLVRPARSESQPAKLSPAFGASPNAEAVKNVARDRLRSENDYKINLKAELEIRHLHEKVDHLVKQQWQRLIEIQQIQLELMEELSERKS